MTRKQLKLAFGFSLVTSAAAIGGPAFGEWITQDDTLAWQLLPWALIALCWVGLFLWSRHARRAA